MSLDVALALDVEDVFRGPEVGNDDIILELAEMLDDVGLTATFFVIGERAKLLAERGRRDIIDAVRRHTVGTHGLSGEHPTIPELCAGQSWSDGVDAVKRLEGEALEIVREVFEEEPCCLSQHFFNAAPQVHAVAAQEGKPYVYGFPAAPPAYGATWFCGSLNLPAETGLSWAYLREDNYADDQAFDVAIEGLWEQLERALAARQPLLVLTLCHPLMLRCIDWPEHVTYANGANVAKHLWAQLPPPRLRTPAEVELALSNVRRVLVRLANDPRLNPVSLADARERFVEDKAVSLEQLVAAAETVVEHNSVALDSRLSPAELCLAFCESLISQAESGHLPASVPRRSPLGPLHDPPLSPGEREVELERFRIAIRIFFEQSCDRGHLVEDLAELGVPAGLGSFYRALAELYLAESNGVLLERVPLQPFNRYPEEARELGHLYLDIAEEIPGDSVNAGRLLAPDLDTGGICRHARLQTWTMKPAVLA